MASSGPSSAISARIGSGSSYRVHRPSRSSTASPPSAPRFAAKAGETTLSIGEATSGISNRYASICQATETSSGSLVRRDGTMPISSSG